MLVSLARIGCGSLPHRASACRRIRSPMPHPATRDGSPSRPSRGSETNSLSCIVYYSGASRNQNETLCVLRASQALTRRTRSISVISVLWLFSRGAHRGTTDAWVSNHSKSTLGSVRLNKNTMRDVQLVLRVPCWPLRDYFTSEAGCTPPAFRTRMQRALVCFRFQDPRPSLGPVPHC